MAVAAAMLVITLSLLWMAAESHYRSCLAEAQARYPAVAVSANTGPPTGPLRVSFVDERTRAVDECGRF